MSRQIFIFILLVTATASFGFSQDKNKISEEIRIMDSRWQVESYSSRDLKDYDRIVADDFAMIGSNGKTVTKAEKRANISADYTEPSTTAPNDYVFKIDETSHQVRIFKNAAISSGFIIEKYVYKGNKVDSRVYFTCTYLKRNGEWQVVAAQYTRVKQA